MTRASLAGLIALIGLAATRDAAAQSESSAAALTQWVAAVRSHRPGQRDPAVAATVALKYSDRVRLNGAMEPFVGALRGEVQPIRSDPQRQVADLYRAVRVDPGLAAFVRRAAVLHTDAAVFAGDFPAVTEDAPVPGPSTTTVDPLTGLPTGASGPRREVIPPLLTNDRQALHTDGRVVGETRAEWNWPFARSLLDLLLRSDGIGTPADRDFVAAWYHAVDAYLFATGRHGDLKTQLLHAADSLPRDPLILFDRGCYAETLGLPYYQVLTGDPAYWNATRMMFVNLPSEAKTDTAAVDLFRRVLEVKPAFVEARVRLARLLERRGRRDEAAGELEKAFAATPDRIVAFYAHLVSGRVDQARGRFAESLNDYASAAELYPDAQSALIGASQAAVMMTNPGSALSFVQRLGTRSEIFEADPWRYYHLGPGREVNELMAALWARAMK